MQNSLSISRSFGLAIHTSSPDLGLAINSFAGDCRCQVWHLERQLSTHLHQYLAGFMPPQTWGELTFLAVAKGPGGFTGTRLGVVTARTLAQQLEIPLFAISSLAAISWQQFRESGQEGAIAIQMPAQRGEIFAGIYQVGATGLTTLMPDAVLSLDDWQQKLDPVIPCHQVPAATGLGATAASLLELAHQEWLQGKRPDWSSALPFYGQHPVPEPKNSLTARLDSHR